MAILGMARGGSSSNRGITRGGGAPAPGGGGFGFSGGFGGGTSGNASTGSRGSRGSSYAPTQAPQLPPRPSAQVKMPPAQQYNPYQQGQAQGLNQNLGQLSQAGAGLMQPGSDYYQQLSQAMQRQIGDQSAAQQRSAALRGAYSGLGAGAAPETMATVGDISQAGLEAQGQAEAGLALQAPGMGAQMLGQTLNPMLGLQQLGEGSRQFGASLGEQGRQFGVNTAMQQQSLAGDQAWRQAQLQQQQQMAQQDALMRQMAMMYGMF